MTPHRKVRFIRYFQISWMLIFIGGPWQASWGESQSAESTDPADLAPSGFDRRRSELFVRLDADQDGTVAGDEIGPEQRRLFDRLVRRGDADGDGKLSSAEWEQALTPDRREASGIERVRRDRAPNRAKRLAMLARLDRNQDGNLSADEIPDRLKERLTRQGLDVSHGIPLQKIRDRLEANPAKTREKLRK